MKGILADVNVQGYVDVLVLQMQADPWRLFWDSLQIQYLHFSDLALALDTSDAAVWQACQLHDLVLITDNRNEDGPDSLGATIRAQNTPTSLPVFTIADLSRLRHSREYGDRVIESLLDALLRIDSLRGVGRLYLP